MTDYTFLKHDIDVDPIFEIHELSEQNKQSLKTSGVWKPECPVPMERLRLLTVTHWDFAGNMNLNGQIMVLDAVAQPALDLFELLFECHFPIGKMQLMDAYRGDDNQSMEDNNTSCFNWRMVAGTTKASLHGYGVAIDINPVQNPCISFPEDQPGIAIYSPARGTNYGNRLSQRPNKKPREGMVDEMLECFYRHGFSEWGGHWDTPIDYHHFQVPRALAEELVAADPTTAAKRFLAHRDQLREKYGL
jgi:hypothetical protein